MADDGSASAATVWPLPKFHFKVELDGIGNAFQEVTGLNGETQTLEYRDGDSPTYATSKMPGLMKFTNVTLKKGVFKGDNKFWDWFALIKSHTIERKPMTISLLDEEGNPTMVWKLTNAFPVRITGTDLKANGNEVAVEAIEIAYESFTIENS